MLTYASKMTQHRQLVVSIDVMLFVDNNSSGKICLFGLCIVYSSTKRKFEFERIADAYGLSDLFRFWVECSLSNNNYEL